MPTTRGRKPTKTLKKGIKRDSIPPKKSSNSFDKAFDRANKFRVKISPLKYKIYILLTKGYLDQTQIAYELKVKNRQNINYHVKTLSILGLVEPTKQNANPKFFKPTDVTPIPSSTPTVVSKSAKIPKRRVGKSIKTVRDHKTGRFKGKRKGRGEEFHRDYDTILSIDGKRIPVLRVHSLSYTCAILREPAEKVPWEQKKAPKGMEQWVLRHKFPNKKSEIAELKKLELTFVRQKTKNYDELVIYLPEKYIFEFELEKTKKIMEEYVWKARKWFQSKYKLWLGLALPYRDMEIAHEIFDPALKRWVQENGMAKIQTKRGRGIVDESKKGFPEREFTTIEQVRANMESGDRILDLEEQMRFMMQQQSQLMEQQRKMVETLSGTTDATQKVQEKTVAAIQEVKGETEWTQTRVLELSQEVKTTSIMQNKMVEIIQKNMEQGKGETEQTRSQLMELSEEVKKMSIMQNKMAGIIQKNMEQDQIERIIVESEKRQDSNINNT